MKLGAVIRAWRERQGYTVQDAAKILGIKKSSLSRLELGNDIDGKNLARVLAWLLQLD